MATKKRAVVRHVRQHHKRTPASFVSVMQEVNAAGLSQTELARAVGASVRSIQGWAAGTAQPTGVRATRLLDVKLVLEKLGDVYTSEGIRIWLHSRNTDLNMERPIDMLERGEIDPVLDEVESLVGGW